MSKDSIAVPKEKVRSILECVERIQKILKGEEEATT